MIERAIYAAFDQYPSAKGASTHIHQMVSAMSAAFGRVDFYSLGSEEIPEKGTNLNVRFEKFNELIPNYLERAHAYAAWLKKDIQRDQTLVQIAHYRDIWSGLAIHENKNILNTLFEVNGLPSIELIYRYRYLRKSTLAKIREIEYHCLTCADQIICPSGVIKNRVMEYGIPGDRIELITNGAELPQYGDAPENLPGLFILFFGAIQPWQGLDVLIRAMSLLCDYKELFLVICSSQKSSISRPYIRLIEKSGLENRVRWYYQLEKDQLNAIIRQAAVSVVPLKENSRNVVQGCSPLKIFESLSNGTPVIASDIPAVREILEDHVTARLIRPDRPAELARAIRLLLDYPEIKNTLAVNGRKLFLEKYQWPQIREQLINLYESILVI